MFLESVFKCILKSFLNLGTKNIEYILLVEKIILTVAGMTVTSEWWRGVS